MRDFHPNSNRVQGESRYSLFQVSTKGGTSSESLLTVEEVAELLKVLRSWVYQNTRRRSQDRIPFVKVGRYLRFREEDLLTYIQHRTVRG